MTVLDIRSFYQRFNAPVTDFDCGEKCAPNNPRGIPFCCDICHTLPFAYRQEWEYLQTNTDLWHVWRGDECPGEPCDPAALQNEAPPYLIALACKGPALCQRDYRSSSCRMFPFFPYITSDDRFIGLACEWEFESVCWVTQHLETVSDTYRSEFVAACDDLFARWPEEFDNFAAISEELRDVSTARHKRFPLLHRSGGIYLVSPGSERLRRQL